MGNTHRLGLSYAGGLAVVFAAGVICTTLVVIYGRYDFPGGAGSFTEWSQVIVHGRAVSPLDFVQRDVGYPFLLVLGGYPFTHSFLGITLINAAFAVALPLLIYQIVGVDHPRLAFATAMIVILSGAPYVFVKLIYHDDAYLFFTALTVYFGITFLRRNEVRYVYLMTAAALATSLTRPMGNLLIIFALAFVFAAERRHWLHYLACIGITVFVASGYALYRHQLRIDDPRDSYTGHQIFFNPYVNSREFGIRIEPDTGPAVARLISSLQSGLAEHPPGSPLFQDWLDNVGSPDVARHAYLDGRSVNELIELVWTHPDYDFFELLGHFELDDRVFRDAAVEIMMRHPLYVLEYTLRNLILFLATDGFVHPQYSPGGSIGLVHNGPYVGPLFGTAVAADSIPPPGADEVKSTPITGSGFGSAIANSWVRWLYRSWRVVLLGIIVSCFALFVIGMWGVLFERRAERLACWFSGLVVLYNGAIVSAFVDPAGRYRYSILPEEILCAAFGALVLSRLVTKRQWTPLLEGVSTWKAPKGSAVNPAIRKSRSAQE